MIFQLIFVGFTLACVVTCLGALIAIWKSKELTWKPLWAIGALVGFVGLGIDWNSADDLWIQVGLQIPVYSFMVFSDGNAAVKSLFPVIALVAIIRVRGLRNDALTEIFDDSDRQGG